MSSAITGTILQAFIYIAVGGIVFVGYYLGRDKHGVTSKSKTHYHRVIPAEVSEISLYKRVAIGLLVITGISLVASLAMGAYSDDIPTVNERIATFALWATLLTIPYLLGAFIKWRYIQTGKAQRDYDKSIAEAKVDDEATKKLFKSAGGAR